jgi:transketolase
MSVAFPNLDVKVVGTHAGISIGEDGPSQMGIEDVSLACSLPGFTVVVPADEPSMTEAVVALARIKTPAYLRAGRPNVPIIYPDGCPFTLGKANRLRDGKDVTIIANGLMVSAALDAAEQLAAKGVQARVLDMHTVKPLDDAAVLAAAKETGRIVVAEEHLLHGGLGSAVALSAARQHPVPMRFVALADTFAESGTPEGLLAKYGLTAEDVVREACAAGGFAPCARSAAGSSGRGDFRTYRGPSRRRSGRRNGHGEESRNRRSPHRDNRRDRQLQGAFAGAGTARGQDRKDRL